MCALVLCARYKPPTLYYTPLYNAYMKALQGTYIFNHPPYMIDSTYPPYLLHRCPTINNNSIGVSNYLKALHAIIRANIAHIRP